MLNAQQIKNKLTLENINKLLTHLNADPHEKNGIVTARTVCHDGDSHKLFYYDNNKIFHCYTNCGSFDVFELIQKVNGVSFKKAFRWIKTFFNFRGTGGYQFVSDLVDPRVEYQKQLEKPELKKLGAYDPKILDSFDDIAYIDWLKQGITPETLAKFHIKLSIADEEIIIPEYDQNSRLIGVRCRHLDPDSLARGQKYTPITYHGETLKYPTGQILYGMNFNKQAINHYHKVILFEAEKSVLKLDSCLGDKNIGVGLNGSHLTDQHIQLLKSMNVHEVIVALDKEFKKTYTKRERIYAEKIQSEFERLKKYFTVSIVWDVKDDLAYKNSPIDKGFKTFKKLMKERIYL